MFMSHRIHLLVVIVLAFNGPMSAAQEWPQWNGPSRDGALDGKELLQVIPEGGLKKLWSTPVALGYAAPVVAGGKVFVSDYQKMEGEITNNPGTRDKLSGLERLHCLDAETGKPLWLYSYSRDYFLSYPSGPRATPAVDEERVYFLGAEGDLACLDVSSGNVIWKRQLRDEYKSTTPIWGYSSSPLIHGDYVYTLAGGEGSLVVALDKMTGEAKWTAMTAHDLGYCPPTITTLNGIETLLIWDPEKLSGLSPLTGEVYWSTPLVPKYEMSITPPTIQGDRMYVSGIGEVAAMYQITSSKEVLKQLWKGKAKHAIYSGNGTPVFDGDLIFGADCEKGSLICIQAEDGERIWETFAPTCGGDRRQSHGTAFLNKVEDRYFLVSETGDFIIAKLSRKGYEEISRFHAIEPTNECFGRKVVWSYPAYAYKHLFLRNDSEIVCYDLSRPK